MDSAPPSTSLPQTQANIEHNQRALEARRIREEERTIAREERKLRVEEERAKAGKPPKEPLLGRLFSLAKGRKNEQLAPPEEGCFTVSNSFEDRHSHLALRRSILERDRAALQQELELASERPRVGDAKPR